MGAARKFKQAQVPRQQGEQARLKVIRGPDVGAVFVIHGTRATVGRGEENDIVLTDLKSSRRHAEIVMTPTGWTVQDLGSANGIVCNGKASRSGALKTKDTLELGETLFEFLSQEAGTIILKSPAPSEEQIKADQAKLAQQRARVVAMSQFGGLAKNRPKPQAVGPMDRRTDAPRPIQRPATRGTDSKQNPGRILLYLGVLAAGYYLMMGPVQTKMVNSHRPQKPKEQTSISYDTSAETPQIEKTVDVFYQEGFREYNHGNYLRARTKFETVLQMDPGNVMAKRYLENSNQAIDGEVRQELILGRQAECSGKLREARGHYSEVMRLLFKNPDDSAYTQAKSHLKELNDQKAVNKECGS